MTAPTVTLLNVFNPKAGIKTSEFWLTLLGQAAALTAQYQGAIPEPWGSVSAVALTAIYTIARQIVKAKTVEAAATVATAAAK